MSIFKKVKEKRAEDKKIAEEKSKLPSNKQEQMESKEQPVPKPVPKPVQEEVQEVKQPGPIPKFKTQEEDLGLTLMEKKEFGKVLLEKHRKLKSKLTKLSLLIEDKKREEKAELEHKFQDEIKKIDDKYDQKKVEIISKYQPVLDRYKNLSEKFGVEKDESKDEMVKEPPKFSLIVDNFKLDEKTTNNEPELSKLIKELDEEII